jgi:predicted DsbA family dithiol-disulfide isomerase
MTSNNGRDAIAESRFAQTGITCWFRPLAFPDDFPAVHRKLFEAHFVLGEDLEDPAVIDWHAAQSGIDLAALHVALADSSATAAVVEAKTTAGKYGVQGTPAWLRPTLDYGTPPGSGI